MVIPGWPADVTFTIESRGRMAVAFWMYIREPVEDKAPVLVPLDRILLHIVAGSVEYVMQDEASRREHGYAE